MLIVQWSVATQIARAQLFPFEHNPAQPIDARQSFVEGMSAVQRQDFPTAIEHLQLAASNLPEVGDYALFYLGVAQDGDGDHQDAADSYRRLGESYPQSVLADAAGVEYARLELALGHPDIARLNAGRVADRTSDEALEQHARLIEAQAAYALNQFSAAYHAAQELRQSYPHGAYDAHARALAYSIVAAHPELTNTDSLEYRHSEAALLIREEQHAAALEQVDAALAMGPGPALRADLYWLRAAALSGDDAQARQALLRYLAVAPGGTHAPSALNTLAHLAWRANDTEQARHYFGQLVSRFPASDEAPQAMFEIGRTYEDDGSYADARSEFLLLRRRYPDSEAADGARFRAPFMLYMEGSYAAGAAEFGTARSEAAEASERDMFSYWRARSLERDGQTIAANVIYHEVAASTASNYYPTMAARKVGVTAALLPAASAPDPVAGPVPSSAGIASFHLTRIAAFRAMNLRELEPGELRAIADDPSLHHFALAEMQAVGAWYDAIQLANSLTKRGAIDPAVAERVRYPRGYWELVSRAAARQQLDPWLVAALIRQESLYNPQARSGSDARGLMQLLPSTAQHWAPAAGLSPASLDLYDPSVSVRIGTAYLKGLFGMFEGDPFKAVAAYNGGEHAVAGWLAKYPGDDDQWVENIGYRETREYVKKVIGGMREYQLLYGGKSTAASSLPNAPSPG